MVFTLLDHSFGQITAYASTITSQYGGKFEIYLHVCECKTVRIERPYGFLHIGYLTTFTYMRSALCLCITLVL